MNGSSLGKVKLMEAKLQSALGGWVSPSWKATGAASNKEKKPEITQKFPTKISCL